MKRKPNWILGLLLAMAVILSGCGSGRSAAPAGEAGDGAAAQTEGSSVPGETPSQSQDSLWLPEGPAGSNAATASGGPASSTGETTELPQITTHEEEKPDMKMNVTVGGCTFTATLEHNAAADALAAMLADAPVTLQMSDYAGFEKVGALGTSLPADNRQTTTHTGDIVLYQGDQIVIFYGSNSWSYTRLGKIDDLNGWEDALGSGNVSVTFSLGE